MSSTDIGSTASTGGHVAAEARARAPHRRGALLYRRPDEPLVPVRRWIEIHTLEFEAVALALERATVE